MASSPPSLWHPRAWNEWRQRRGFLRQFVGRGDLVFDIGANVGEYSETFLQLGARPIAVEPNPELTEALRSRLPGVPVEASAVSDSTGVATFVIGDRHREATIDDGYTKLLRGRGQKLRSFSVAVTTLDMLAKKYGQPVFVKIDVEGHEAAVLRGMTFKPRALSFEYHPSVIDSARESLEILAGHGYQFRGTIGFRCVWETPITDVNGILRLFDRAESIDPGLFGDVYALRLNAFHGRVANGS